MMIKLRFRVWVLGLGFMIKGLMIRIRVSVCESALFNALMRGENVVGLGNGNENAHFDLCKCSF
jgi:hypothetical protein